MTDQRNIDWIDNYGFILVAFAHMTNWCLSDAEIQTISAKLQLMLSQSNQDYNEEQVSQKLVKILHRYESLKEEKGKTMMENLLTAMNCIMCGCCVSDCTVLEVDDNFIGPAALAKAWRFVDDPRDSKKIDRLKELNDEDGGFWDCTRCMQCVEVCPKGVDPMDRIMELRDMALTNGLDNTYGAKHASAVSNHIEHSGRIDEFRLPLESKGIFNIKEIFKLMLPGLRFALRKRAPSPLHFKNPNQKFVKNLFKKVEK